MKIIYFLFGWTVKITGFIPRLILLRFKTHYENKNVQGRKIKGKAIVVSNHLEVWDFALMMYLFPLRTLRCVVADLMFNKNFPMRFFLTAMGCIKVEREAHDFAFVGKCKEILDKGGVVEIYPESRINFDKDTELLDFKPSTVYLALESGAPIIPIYHNGKYFKGSELSVIIGTPIDARALYDDTLSEKENISNINDILRGKILELKHELERKEKEENRA